MKVYPFATGHELLMRSLADNGKQNVSVDREQYIEGMIAEAVPFRGRNGTLYSTVSFHAPVVRMELTTALQYAPRLHQAAKDLGQLIEEQLRRIKAGPSRPYPIEVV
ncbi:MAG: IclR family transcriptional regulator C-terminal domain-containing protein [Arenicellales bacterium]